MFLFKTSTEKRIISTSSFRFKCISDLTCNWKVYKMAIFLVCTLHVSKLVTKLLSKSCVQKDLEEFCSVYHGSKV